jgi:hypothetical protein
MMTACWEQVEVIYISADSVWNFPKTESDAGKLEGRKCQDLKSVMDLEG